MMQRLTLTFGEMQVIIMKDFEALGRYTNALDEIWKRLSSREMLLHKLESHLRSGSSPNTSTRIREYDLEKMRELLSQAIELDKQIHAFADEANANAPLCDKPKVEFHKRQFDS